MKRGQSVSNWNPGEGKGRSNNDKLLSTEAHDAKDTMTGTNELKAFEGKAGKPKAPFGLKGKDF